MTVATQPDVEAWVWQNIRHLNGVTSFAFSGNTDHPGWQTRIGIQVDCRARRKKQARDLSELVRQIVLGLPDVQWDEGQLTYVSVTDGPIWLPDDPDGTPRYTTRFELRVHPIRPS